MSGSKRFIVLEVMDQAEAIKECIEYISLSQPGIGLRQDFTVREALQLLYYITRDLVDGRLAHKTGNPENVEQCVSIIFGMQRNKLLKVHHECYRTIQSHSVWQGAVSSILNQINKHIEMSTWTDWTVVKVGTLISLSEGEDHRIAEFHKEDKLLSEDDEALVTINCINPINYVYNQFKLTYGANMNTLFNHVTDPNTKMDPFYRQLISNFMADPTEFIAGIFLDTLIKMNPQIELAQHAPKLSITLLKLLGIHNLERFQSEIVSKLIIAFGLGWLGHNIKKDESYALEYYNTTSIMAIFKKRFTTMTEKYEEDLLRAFIRNDYLPDSDRAIAERLYLERPQLVLNLSQ